MYDHGQRTVDPATLFTSSTETMMNIGITTTGTTMTGVAGARGTRGNVTADGEIVATEIGMAGAKMIVATAHVLSRDVSKSVANKSRKICGRNGELRCVSSVKRFAKSVERFASTGKNVERTGAPMDLPAGRVEGTNH